jgi:hypothetical protein
MQSVASAIRRAAATLHLRQALCTDPDDSITEMPPIAGPEIGASAGKMWAFGGLRNVAARQEVV